MLRVREERSLDGQDVRRLVELAFGREAEARLVERLRAGDKVRLALVAEDAGRVLGQVLFSEVSVGMGCPVLALAPLSVLPAYQRLGVGSALVSEALQRLRGGGYAAVLVLGDPSYYARFGFVPATRFGIACPFPAPEDAFMALELTPGSLAGNPGPARYGHEFDDLE
jgi:putative acetyltransferase